MGCRQYLTGVHPYGSPNMPFQLPVSVSTSLSDGGSSCSRFGRDNTAVALGFPANSNGYGRGAGGRHTNVKQNLHTPRKDYPGIHPVIRSGKGKAFLDSCRVEGSAYFTTDDNGPENDICGRHFLFDKKYEKLQQRATLFPPLAKDYHHVHRAGNLHCLSLTKGLSHGPAERPFALGAYEKHNLNASPAILFPSALALSGRNAFTMEHYKLSRPKVNYRTCNLFAVQDNKKRGQSYPDPMIGAPHSFIHRISEISSLDGETMRQERLKKIRRSRKLDS